MDHNKLVQKLLDDTLPLLQDEALKVQFTNQVELIKKQFTRSEFKLKRTLRDKQITTSVLETTISELKIQTENLKHQKTLTEEQAEFKEQLFAKVSHELRTPLHGILGMSHLLENSQLNLEQRGFIDIIRGSADNLLVIINDILNLSKINAGKTTLIIEPFSTEKFLNDLKGVVEFKAKGKGLNLLFSPSPNLPKFLTGDRTRLYQVLLNLLNNAIKYTDKGHVALKIHVLSTNEKEITLKFEIKDTGIGIDSAVAKSIYDSFTQLDIKSNGIYSGVGLGLNIVKKLVNLMDGTIDLESKVGEGSIFSVKLAFAIPSEDLIDTNKNTIASLTFPKAWQDMKLLMLEDNEANLVYAQNLFASGNITLEIAKDIKGAKVKLARNKYDCFLSDVKLPDGNGLDLIAELRGDNSAINQTTPIIVLTASANEKEANHAEQLNVQSYIGKPFPPQLLIKEMKKIMKLDLTKKEKTSVNLSEYNTATAPYFANLEKSFKGKPRLQIEMFDIFLDQLPLAIEQMGKGLKENDLKIFHYDAHRIKSTINIVDLPKLKPLIYKMDEYCYRKINLDELPGLYEAFKKQAALDIKLIHAKKEALMVSN